jgi:hypothetical protein
MSRYVAEKVLTLRAIRTHQMIGPWYVKAVMTELPDEGWLNCSNYNRRYKLCVGDGINTGSSDVWIDSGAWCNCNRAVAPVNKAKCDRIEAQRAAGSCGVFC